MHFYCFIFGVSFLSTRQWKTSSAPLSWGLLMPTSVEKCLWPGEREELMACLSQFCFLKARPMGTRLCIQWYTGNKAVVQSEVHQEAFLSGIGVLLICVQGLHITGDELPQFWVPSRWHFGVIYSIILQKMVSAFSKRFYLCNLNYRSGVYQVRLMISDFYETCHNTVKPLIHGEPWSVCLHVSVCLK